MGLGDGGIKFCSLNTAGKKTASVIRLPAGDDSVQSLASGDGAVWWTTRGGKYVYAYTDATHTVTRYDVTASVVTLPEPTPPAAPETPPPRASDAATAETVPPTDVPAAPLAFLPETPPAPPSTPAPFPTGWVRQVVLPASSIHDPAS